LLYFYFVVLGSAVVAYTVGAVLVRLGLAPEVVVPVVVVAALVVSGRSLASGWRVRDGRLEIRGVFVNRSIPVEDIVRIEWKHPILPVNINAQAVHLRDGTERRVPSSLRGTWKGQRQQREELRLALGLAKDEVWG
jgi:hypothetical protein